DAPGLAARGTRSCPNPKSAEPTMPNVETPPAAELASYCEDLGHRARAASQLLAAALGGRKNAWLLRSADALESRPAEILAANEEDIAGARELGLTAAQVDRLRLSPERLRAMAAGLREVAALPDPVGRVLDSSVRPNGLQVAKVAVPLGVIFFI